MEIDPAARFATAAQVGFLLNHPDEVHLTQRAERTARDGFAKVARRWVNVKLGDGPASPLPQDAGRAPLIAAAVEIGGDGRLHEAMRREAARLLQTASGSRLACIAVNRTPLGIDLNGGKRHVEGLVALKHWARSLAAEEGRISYHVLEGSEIAGAVLEFAANNHIDHLIIGARAESPHPPSYGTLPRPPSLGPVAIRVVSQAPCTVTVVRAPTAETRN